MNNKELIKQYSDGDLDAFHVFYEGCRKKFYTYVHYRFREKADDIYQNSFMIFLQEVQKKEIKYPLSYLYKIAMSLGIKEQKKKKDFISTEMIDIVQENEEPVYPITEEELQQSLAWLAKEKPDFYDVLHLHLYEKITFDSISEITRENRNTITSRYRYALYYLKKYLDPIIRQKGELYV